jgi:tetratricopeptide (TPR) repeat protein
MDTESDEVEPALNEADAVLQSGDVDTARTMYAKVLNRDPRNLRALWGLARIELRESLEKALPRLSALVAVRPHDPDLVQAIISESEAAGADPAVVLQRLLAEHDDSSAIVLGLASLSLHQNRPMAQEWLERLWRFESDDADAWVNRATARLWTDDLQSAIRDYDKALALSPSPDTYASRGQAYFALADHSAALADFHKVSELVPQSAFGPRLCGDVYRAMDDLPNATAAYTEALRRDPDDADAHSGLGLAYEKQKEFVKALAEYDHVVRLAPENALGYLNRGDVHVGLEHYDAALQDFGRASELAPDWSHGPRRTGDVHLTMEDIPRAIEAYKRALERDTNDAGAHNGLGLAYEAQNKYEPALAEYDRVVELSAESPIGYQNRGNVYLALQRYEAALADFRRVAELDSASSLGPRRLGDVYQAKGDPEKAIASYQDALARDVNDADAHNGLGLAYEALRRYPEALAAYQRVVALLPGNAAGLANRGDTYLAMGDYAAALEDFRRVMELAPESSFGYRRSGDVEVSRGNPKKALEWYEQALTRDKDDADVHNGLGIAQEGLGNLREALRHYEDASRLRPEPLFLNNRGSVLVSLLAYDRAVDAYEAAIRLDENDAGAHQGKADALRLWADTMDLPGKLSQALTVADRAAVLDSEDATIQAIRGIVLAKLGYHPDAMEAFDAALKLDPTYAWARKEKAKALYGHGDLEEALHELRELAEKNPDLRMDAFTGQVLVVKKLERSADVNDARLALAAIADANAHLEQARRFVDFSAWEDARTSYREALKMNPSLADAHNELAWYQATELKRDLDECTVHALLAVELAGDDPARGNYLDTLGWVWYKRGEIKDAQKYLEEAIRFVEPDVRVRHHLEIVKRAAADQVAADHVAAPERN